MALGASKPSQREEFICHRTWSRRLQRNLYFSRKSLDDCCSLPLTLMAARAFSDRPGGRLRCLPVRDAASVSHQACLSPAALVLAMVYLERLATTNAEFLQNADPKQLFVASTLAASKYLYDSGEDERTFNDEWAASAELEVQQLNQAEREFLAAMDWELYVSDEAFEAMSARLETAAALAESRRRGWLTYSDAVAVGTQTVISSTLNMLTDALIKVVAVCSVAYLASVITLFSSVCLVFDAPPVSSAPPAVFVARAPPAAGPDGSPGASLLGQLTAGLSLLAVVAPFGSRDGRAPQPAGDAEESSTMDEREDVLDGGEEEMNDTWRDVLPDSLPARLPRLQVELEFRARLTTDMAPDLTAGVSSRRHVPEPLHRLPETLRGPRRHVEHAAYRPGSSADSSNPLYSSTHAPATLRTVDSHDAVSPSTNAPHFAYRLYDARQTSRKSASLFDDDSAFAPPARLSLDVFPLKTTQLPSHNSSLTCGWALMGGGDVGTWAPNVVLCR